MFKILHELGSCRGLEQNGARLETDAEAIA